MSSTTSSRAGTAACRSQMNRRAADGQARHRRWAGIAGTAVVVSMLVAGCGGSEVTEGGGPPASPSTSLVAEPVEQAPSDDADRADGNPSDDADDAVPSDVEEEILAAVQGYWDTMAAARQPPDPDHAGFDVYLTGEALAHSRARTERMAILGHTVDGDPVVDLDAAEVTVGSAGSATVRHCLIDDALVLVAATGEVVNDEVLSGVVQLDLVRTAGRWQVSSTDAHSITPGRVGCE